MNERSSNGAGSSLINSRNTRYRSRMLWKHDWEIEEICWANDRFSSKMSPRLRAESTSEGMTLLGRWMVGLLSLESCCGWLKMRNSVLEGLRDRKLEDIQLDTVIVFSRWVMLWEKSRAEKTSDSCRYNACGRERTGDIKVGSAHLRGHTFR